MRGCGGRCSLIVGFGFCLCVLFGFSQSCFATRALVGQTAVSPVAVDTFFD